MPPAPALSIHSGRHIPPAPVGRQGVGGHLVGHGSEGADHAARLVHSRVLVQLIQLRGGGARQSTRLRAGEGVPTSCRRVQAVALQAYGLPASCCLCATLDTCRSRTLPRRLPSRRAPHSRRSAGTQRGGTGPGGRSRGRRAGCRPAKRGARCWAARGHRLQGRVARAGGGRAGAAAPSPAVFRARLQPGFRICERQA